MAIARSKEDNFKLENILLSGDYIKNEVLTKVNNDTTLTQSKIAGEGDGNVLDIITETNTYVADNESAYEDCFYSDNSEDALELTNVMHRSSTNEIPSFRFTNSNSFVKQQNSTNLNRRFVSTSKICDNSSFSLENRVKCLSLDEVRPTGSVQLRSTRKNMSFTNDEIMKIERDNEILLRKIMAQQKSQKVKIQPIKLKLSSSAINRKKLQKKIEEDNMMLLRRLQQAKSCALNTNKIPGYRATYL